MSEQTVTINGIVYDAHTGLRMESDQSTPVTPPTLTPQPSHAVHASLQKSHTLNRRIVQKHKPSLPSKASVKKSPMITRFATGTMDIKPGSRPTPDIGPVPHPLITKAEGRKVQALQTAPSTSVAPKPAQIIKQEAIQEALAKTPARAAAKRKTKKLGRLASVGSLALALLLLGGYFTYLNMPSLSVRVAAAQAGVNATYPDYHPDGYSLSGAVAYSQGQVSMKFASNSGPQNFTLNQSKSSWDSSAVLDNYIKEKAGDNYITYNERGLTIYTYGSNAAWVNGGILYTLTGNAPLSSDQIRHIATSM